MAKKRADYTPNSAIRSAIRKNIWLRSRERATALKRTAYCCEVCGVKQSKAKGKEVKLEVHHTSGIDWDGLINEIRKRLLPPPDRLQPLCKKCHEEKTTSR